MSLILCSCEPEHPASNQVQVEYLQSKIKSSRNKLQEKVEETGYSPAGKTFIEISEQFTAKTNQLISRISNNEAITLTDIRDLENLAIFKYDTIQLDTAFVHQAFKQYQTGNSKDFITSLLMFNLSTINNTRELFQSYFYDVEYFKPVVISSDFAIKKGETFKGTAISQAKMAAVKYLYEIDDPQTEEGFIELPGWAISGYDGIIRIKGTTIGTHKVKIRSIHYADGSD